MYSHVLDQWVWFFYSLTFTVAVIWTGALFFKRRSAATWFLLTGAVVMALGTITPAVIYQLGPRLGLQLGFDRYGEKPAYMLVVENAWFATLAGTLCFQAALWYVLRKSDESSQRIAELEAALHASHEPAESSRP